MLKTHIMLINSVKCREEVIFHLLVPDVIIPDYHFLVLTNVINECYNLKNLNFLRSFIRTLEKMALILLK